MNRRPCTPLAVTAAAAAVRARPRASRAAATALGVPALGLVACAQGQAAARVLTTDPLFARVAECPLPPDAQVEPGGGFMALRVPRPLDAPSAEPPLTLRAFLRRRLPPATPASPSDPAPTAAPPAGRPAAGETRYENRE